MARIKEIEFIHILHELPEIVPLKCEEDLLHHKYDVFIGALGFEDRCLVIPEKLSNTTGFKCREALYFEYSTNVEDNEVNRPGLLRSFLKFTDSQKSLQCNEDNFISNLREHLKQIIELNKKPKILFDISVCSSKLLLSVIKVLFEFDVDLKIVYSEAEVYHPTFNEFNKERNKLDTEEDYGIASGVEKVILSPEYPGSFKENPDLIVAFLTFKPERTKAIIADIDETLLIRPDKRIMWIVGNPHIIDEEIKRQRKEIMKEINNIPLGCPTYEVSTFDYKETLKTLDKIYNDNNLEFNINISALGSKMQTLGIAIFCYVRPEVSVYFAIPKKYNPKRYSEGCKATWQINFYELGNTRKILDKVGQLEI